jgi:PAS domain S-box-containing protein
MGSTEDEMPSIPDDRFFKDLAEFGPVLVRSAGADGRYDWFNAPWLRFTGRTIEQQAGDGWAASIHPEDIAHCLRTSRSSFDTRTSFAMTYRLKRHDGQFRQMLDNAAPYFREQVFAGFIASCVDVTGLTSENGELIGLPREQRSACVLVVEDNIAVGEFVVGALDELGYDSILVTNAQDALETLASNAARFDVIFSDVVMPGMSGLELGETIWRTYPHIPVILTSGYSKVVEESGPHGFELLQKPYAIEQLSGALNKALAFGKSLIGSQ